MTAKLVDNTIQIDAVHTEVLKYFPNYDYNNPNGDRSVLCDYRNRANAVGHQQRAFSVFWALQKCDSLNLGLDLGSPRGLTPFCIHVDVFGSGADHPIYGGAYFSDVVLDASNLLPIFPNNAFPYITSNHSIEHMGPHGVSDSDVAKILCGWLRALKHDGVLALVVPDNDAFDVMGSDKDHKNAWGHSDFRRRVLDAVLSETGAELVEFDSFQNNFSFNVVLRKK